MSVAAGAVIRASLRAALQTRGTPPTRCILHYSCFKKLFSFERIFYHRSSGTGLMKMSEWISCVLHIPVKEARPVRAEHPRYSQLRAVVRLLPISGRCFSHTLMYSDNNSDSSSKVHDSSDMHGLTYESYGYHWKTHSWESECSRVIQHRTPYSRIRIMKFRSYIPKLLNQQTDTTLCLGLEVVLLCLSPREVRLVAAPFHIYIILHSKPRPPNTYA